MKEIFIKYNPYKLETEVTIDGQAVKKNSALNVTEKRMQEWVEDLPRILVEECNVKDFTIKFYGTILDFEDLASVVAEAKKDGINIILEHIRAKEVGDKEQAIAEIFEEIQSGPFEELKQPNIIQSFEQQKSKEFPVNVVATMSAGKSTLINALLRQKLMPAKQEACTAMITKIKDNDSNGFAAFAYDSQGGLVATYPEITLDDMKKLNGDECVSTVEVQGNIPFVSSDEVSLVLVDTPGPNNSRDPEHKLTTYRMINESSKTLVLYIMNATQLNVNDDDNLLSYVAESMKVGGKQSKDRFIFVVNKLDTYDENDDSVVGAIEKVKNYLEEKGIKNPNVYPASALTALNIRTKLSNVDFSNLDFNSLDTDMFNVIGDVKKINTSKELHLETYAPLTPSVRGVINSQLAEAEERSDEKKQALIHTGIIPIEEAIKMYVAKYAKTAKVKNIVDTFYYNIESAKTMENLKLDIANNEEKCKELLNQIALMEKAINDGNDAKEFKKIVDKIDYSKKTSEVAKTIVKDAHEMIRKEITNNNGLRLTKNEAETKLKAFKSLVEAMQTRLRIEMESKITEKLKENANELLETYKDRIKKFSDKIDVDMIGLDPYKMMNADLNKLTDYKSVLEGATKTESEWEVVGSHKEYKEILGFRRWCNDKFGTSFNVDYDVVDDYDWVEKEYIDAEMLANRFFAPIEKELMSTQTSVTEYAKAQCKSIKTAFNKEFDKLDKMLEDKLLELKICANDKNITEESIKESQKKVEWLDNIQTKVLDILEI